jgi:hypothetical protein
MRCGVLNIIVLLPACTALRREDPTTVDIVEIAIRKLISPFGIFALRLVDPQIPFPLYGNPM